MDSKDLKQVVIVTGSNSGIGRETALSLAKDGMKVFMACRSADRGREAASYIREACPGADVEVLLLNLKTLESVRKCAADFKSRNLPLKLLINNAGVFSKIPWYTAEGVGGSTQVNHLGHYLFTRLLEDSLLAGAPSRVINVSSIRSREFKFPDPRGYSGEIFQRFQIWQLYALQACKHSVYLRIATTMARERDSSMRSGSWSTFNLSSYFSDIRDASEVAFAPTWDGAIPVYHAATTPLETDHEKTPFRLFARGAFAWWGVTRPNSRPMFWLTGLPATVLDWPVRNLSKGALFSKVVLVPANPQAYDEDLASKLWSLSADVAGISE